MVTVFIVVRKVRPVVTVQVSGEDGLVEVYIVAVGIWLSEAGVTAFESDAVDELERCFPVAGCNPSPLVRLINALCHPDLDQLGCRIGISQGVLQIVVGIGPA